MTDEERPRYNRLFETFVNPGESVTDQMDGLVAYSLSSVQLTARKAAEDIELGDEKVLIKRGEGVICLLGAGNRDPARYDDPEKLDITRQNVRPLSFGGGIHHCLGAQLARLEGEITFRALAERLPKLTLENIDTPQWRPTLTLRRLAALPARWEVPG